MENLLNTLCPLEKMGRGIKNIRHKFFQSIETEIQAYLLGFIAADGSIDEKRNVLSVHVSEIDIEIVQLFQRWISPESKIETYIGNTFDSRGKTYKSKKSVRIDITSKQLISDLRSLGITQAKTWKELHIPNIKDSLIKHFIRGYFDGDGCFSMSVRKPNSKNREKNYKVSAQVEVYCKRDEILKDIRAFILKETGIEMRIYYIERDDMFKIRTGKSKDIKALFSYLYNSTFYLSRKFNKFNYYVNTEVSQIISDTVTHRECNNFSTSSEHPTSEDENIC